MTRFYADNPYDVIKEAERLIALPYPPVQYIDFRCHVIPSKNGQWTMDWVSPNGYPPFDAYQYVSDVVKAWDSEARLNFKAVRTDIRGLATAVGLGRKVVNPDSVKGYLAPAIGSSAFDWIDYDLEPIEGYQLALSLIYETFGIARGEIWYARPSKPFSDSVYAPSVDNDSVHILLNDDVERTLRLIDEASSLISCDQYGMPFWINSNAKE